MAKPGSSGADDSVSIEQLQQEIVTLKTTMAKLVQANSIECVIQNGLQGLATMLEPLRALRPPRTPLERFESAALAAIHATLEHPDYSNLEVGLEDFGKPAKGKNEGKAS